MFVDYLLSKFFLTILLLLLLLVLYWFLRRFLVAFILFVIGIVVIFVPDQIAMGRWDELCRTDGGLRVYETHAVDGFYFQGGGIEDATAYLKRGYKYIEFDSGKFFPPGSVATLSAEKKDVSYSEGKVLSKYKYSLIYYTINDELSASETRVAEVKSGKIIALIKTLYFFGGPVYRAMKGGRRAKSSDYVNVCPRGPQIDSLVNSVIPPK
ncbi:hypothetical protein [Pseudomonas sp.]|uniref:hypothetical protein n=1 Tax=Pseudomonas sp. TaxID=306 RepID=UPI002590042A|nr:hypothetical protein [Pseudomonas sp.]